MYFTRYGSQHAVSKLTGSFSINVIHVFFFYIHTTIIVSDQNIWQVNFIYEFECVSLLAVLLNEW